MTYGCSRTVHPRHRAHLDQPHRIKVVGNDQFELIAGLAHQKPDPDNDGLLVGQEIYDVYWLGSSGDNWIGYLTDPNSINIEKLFLAWFNAQE